MGFFLMLITSFHHFLSSVSEGDSQPAVGQHSPSMLERACLCPFLVSKIYPERQCMVLCLVRESVLRRSKLVQVFDNVKSSY